MQIRIKDNTCPGCGKTFFVRYLNIIHLRSAKKCREYVLKNCPILPDDIIASAIKKDNETIRSNIKSGLPKHYAFS